MRVFIIIASIAVITILVCTETSYRASAARVATLDADWGNLELRKSNGCFDDPFGEAVAAYVPKRIAAGYDAAIARSRSITIVVATAVSMCGCLLVHAFTHIVRFDLTKMNAKSV